MTRGPSVRGLTVLYSVVGALLVGLALPLVARRVPPNQLYGFRVPRTVDNPAVWYPANAFAGWCLMGAGLVVAGTAIGVRRRSPSIGPTRYTLICSSALLVSVLAAFGLSVLYLESLPDDP